MEFKKRKYRIQLNKSWPCT